MAVVFTSQGKMKGQKFKDTGVLLSQVVHPNIENKLFLKNKNIVDKEVAEAQELEAIFQEIKDYVRTDHHMLKNDFVEGILENLPQDIKQLFNYDDMSNYAAGAAFERDLGNIISSVFEQMEGITPDYQKIELGAQTATAGLGVTLTYPMIESVFGKKFIEQVLKYAVEPVIDQTSGDVMYKLKDKQGKIDILSPTNGTITLDYEGNDKLTRFYSLLSGASFTAKNYLVRNNDRAVRVKLGSTSSFRVYMSTLSFSNPELNQDERVKIYFASRNTRNAIAKEHKKHIRFVYELIGPGLYYNGISLGECKFLIVNERNGPGIRVFSTKQLIYNLFYLGQGAGVTASQAHLSVAFTNDNI